MTGAAPHPVRPLPPDLTYNGVMPLAASRELLENPVPTPTSATRTSTLRMQS